VKAALVPGQTVLVQGAGGGLATAAISLAHAAGLTIIACAREGDKLAAARKLGAHHTVPLDREAAKRIIALTGGAGVDAVIDSVGEPTWATSLRAVKQGGKVVIAGATAGPNPPADLTRIFWRQISIVGSTMGTILEFRRLLSFVEATGIKPRIDGTFRLAQARHAFDRLAAGDQNGKIVIEIASGDRVF
jgi:NADPH:quinone reductase-like Zn-dependent oxidoreductase